MSGSGFHRQSKLHNGAEFQRVFDAPDRSSDALFTVLATPNGRDYSRLGLAIGRKRIRLAVKRNRIKRLVRESFRHHPDRLVGLDVVVMARFDGKKKNLDIFRSLERHWARLGVNTDKQEHSDAGHGAKLRCR